MRIIYQVRCRVNNKVYIGKTIKTVDQRWREHLGCVRRGRSNLPFHNAIRKYGPENFDVWVLYTDAVSEGHLNMLEEMFIRQFKSNNPHYGYNMTPGGDGGPVSPEVGRKISKALKGRKPSKETRRKMRKAAKGRVPCPEAFRKSVESRKGKPLSKKHRRNLRKAWRRRKTVCSDGFPFRRAC